MEMKVLKDDKVFEADGVDIYSKTQTRKKIRAAVSRKIPKCYEESMAGHIDWKLNKKNEKIDGKMIVDVYFMKLQI